MDLEKENIIKKESDEFNLTKEVENGNDGLVKFEQFYKDNYSNNVFETLTEKPKHNIIAVKKFTTTVPEEQTVDRTEICRLCASNITEKLYSIFESHEVSLHEKINFCLPITVNAEDGLPNNICETCKDNLEESYKFANKVVMATEILKSRFSKNKDVPSEGEIVDLKTSEPECSKSSAKEGDNKHITKLPATSLRGHYECHLCKKKFRFHHHLKAHSENHKDLVSCVMSVCSFCGEAFTTEELASSHIVSHMGKNVHMEHTLVQIAYKCEFCEKIFVNCNKLMYHKKCEHQLKIYSCGVCLVKFTTHNRREEHKKMHICLKGASADPELPIVIHYLCESCGKSYLQYEYLNAHQKLKHKIPPHTYKCQKCKEVFPNGSAIAYHYKQKHNINHFLCPEKNCHQQFATEALLKKHLNDSHKPPVVCYKCGKIFLDKPALRQHIQNNHTIALHICEICGHTFKTAQAFQAHRSEHLEGKEVSGSSCDFTCIICKKQYSQRHELQKHMRMTHSGNFRLLVDMEEDTMDKDVEKSLLQLRGDMENKNNSKNDTLPDVFLDSSNEFITSASFIDGDKSAGDVNMDSRVVYLNNYARLMDKGDFINYSNDDPTTSNDFEFPDFANNIDDNGQMQYYFVNVEGSRKVLLLDNS